jgi:hypothetical protein
MARPKPWYLVVTREVGSTGKGTRRVTELFGVGPFTREGQAAAERQRYAHSILTQNPPDTLTIVRPLEAQQ